MPAKNPDLHGNAPDKSDVAILLIDVINDLEFPEGDQLLCYAVPMAERIAWLKDQARRAGAPVIYVNDNFGRWRSDFNAQVEHCLRDGVRGRPIAERLRPGEGVVPADCVASNTEEENRHALEQMRKVLKADIRP